jgi:hypothetical protein
MTKSSCASEENRRAALVAAEKRAQELFGAIEQRQLLQSGRDEREIEKEIYSIALREFGVEKHWHKRIVRSGPNTLTMAADNPPFAPSRPTISYTWIWGRCLKTGRLIWDEPTSWEIIPAPPWLPICRSSSNESRRTTMHRPGSRGPNSMPSPKSQPKKPDGFLAVRSRGIWLANSPTRRFPATRI